MELARNRLEQSDLGETAKRPLCRSGSQNLVVLLEQPRLRALRNLAAVRADGVDEHRFDREVEPRGERDCANHAHRVLAEPHVGIANGTHDAVSQIGEAVDVIDDRERPDVVEQRVDGEIAPERVFLGCAERVVVMDEMFAFGCRRIGRGHAVGHDFFAKRDLTPECGDLDHLLAELHVRETESPADDPAIAEQFLDLIRMRRRADVEVFGMTTENQVADAAADEIRDVIELSQTVEDFERVGIDVSARDRMRLAPNDPRLAHPRHCTKRSN